MVEEYVGAKLNLAKSFCRGRLKADDFDNTIGGAPVRPPKQHVVKVNAGAGGRVKRAIQSKLSCRCLHIYLWCVCVCIPIRCM